MIQINARALLILTIITITVWIGYETYSTLTTTARKVVVKQDLLRELEETENKEVIDDLKTRITY